MADETQTLLDEVMEANTEFLAERPAPRPRSLGEHRLLVVTCMDPRLTALLPRAMGVAPEEMFQVRSAGNRVLGPDGDPVRSVVATLALRAATEVFLIGHTDCLMRRATAMSLLDGMKAVGLNRDKLGGSDVREWFGAIASERTNALEGARAIRRSPYLPPGTPVHALLVDTATGKLEILDAGYGEARHQKDSEDMFTGRGAPSPDPGHRFPDKVVEPSILDTVPLTALEPEPPPILEPTPLKKQRKPPPLPVEKPPPPPPPRKPKSVPKPKPKPAKQKKAPSSPFERAEDVLERLLKRRGK